LTAHEYGGHQTTIAAAVCADNQCVGDASKEEVLYFQRLFDRKSKMWKVT
jgi:hypothetical protein